MRLTAYFASAIFGLLNGWASGIADFPQIGAHFPIISFEKNENPMNIMEIYTQLNADCSFKRAGRGQPILGFYWLMDRQRYKPVHSLILSAIRHRLELMDGETDHGFQLRLNDLRELKSDLKEPVLSVRSIGKNAPCEVEATVRLGPSDGERIIRITSIYSESRKTFWPPFRKLTSITLVGVDVPTGEHVRRTYFGK